MVSVKDLKQKLIGMGVTEEEFAGLNKEALQEYVDKLGSIEEAILPENMRMAGEEALAGLPVEATQSSDSNRVEQVPSYNNEDWETYVMSKFAAEELANGIYPKLSGLRRLVTLLGDIVESRPIDSRTDYPDGQGNPGRAVCQYVVRIAWKVGLPDHALGLMGVKDLPIVTFGAVGGASYLNMDDFISKYPEAIAESRAEARTLRKALRLSTVSADEITRGDMKRPTNPGIEASVSPETDVPTKITTAQIRAIKNMSQKLQINVDKFINMGSGKYNTIEDVPYDKALIMVRELNNYQSTDRDSSKSIPDSIKL